MLFDDDLKKLINDNFDDPENVNDNQIQKYILEECVLNFKRMRKYWKKSCRYSFLVF